MNKPFIVATNADYMTLVIAKDAESAVKKSRKFYKKEYGEDRDDFEAYDLMEYLENDEVFPIRAWDENLVYKQFA